VIFWAKPNFVYQREVKSFDPATLGFAPASIAAMRGYQYGLFGTERIPLPGGVPNFQALYTDAFQGANGWADTGVGGSSFVYWVELTPNGPVGKQIQVQGQSSNSASPYYAVQTRLYSQGKYLDIRFTEPQIAADPNLTVKVVRGNPDTGS